MTTVYWETPFWPKGVARTISDYHYPLSRILDDTAQKYPEQTFTLFNGKARTYAQTWDTANRVANFLAQYGIKKGDRVAIFLPNIPQFPEIFFGILKAGAVCVNCNPMYTASELNHQLSDSGARMIFCMDHPTLYDTVVTAIEHTDVETVVICNIKSYLPAAKALMGSLLGKIPKAARHLEEHLNFDDIVADAAPSPPVVEIDPEKDAAVMLYTGGTTGVPKGAELTHTNFTYDLKAAHEFFQISHAPGEAPESFRPGGAHTILGVLPWYHSFGLTGAMLFSVFSGNRLICIPDPRAGKPAFTDMLKAVVKYRPTFVPGVPTLFVAITNHPHLKKYDLSAIKACICAGAPMPPEVCRQFEEKTGAILFEVYGLTETAPAVTSNPPTKEHRKIGSIGFPIPGTDVKIVDIDTGTTILPIGEEGELAVHGPQVMKGYWKRPDANAETFTTLEDKRYFLTGDIARIDEDGYISITDRKKDMIIVSGFNVYPREIEDALYAHPSVALAAVVGVPDEKQGEAVKAFVALKPGLTASEAELMAFCKEKLTGYKRPRFIEFTDDIPTSNVGKVLRRALK
ncbi:long-chain acyl-CoA synthetase [Desulfocicer vacuolatum DSM 3385]|uniref:Long-chain acyl-CoA synthetase n=1 Tax=Desulfocicer vacuolatum DSM 3385 TaxID=1121400 RepID=A0A1W2CAZ1_9BACT|nr:long-chain fatty acid--CoA ligase [Desulfocicer vacuolatum]SMC82340.1 long-chain acyl-CoA synthetase [Desulfocicer vacuolatum DSM 3385]